MPHHYRRTSHGLIATEGEEIKMIGNNGINNSFRLNYQVIFNHFFFY